MNAPMMLECGDCGAYYPMGLTRAAGRKYHAKSCPRARIGRRAKFVVAWAFDRSPRATVAIEVDPRDGSAQLVIRPYRRRLVVRADLASVAAELCSRHIKAEVAQRRKNRRKTRG